MLADQKMRFGVADVILLYSGYRKPFPVAARSKVYGRSPAEIVSSNTTQGMDVCVVSVVCCQVEVSATD